MIYTPRYIIYTAVCRYLDEDELGKLKHALGKSEKITDASFIKIIEQHFDFTLMRDKPHKRQDVLLFNYLRYENKKKDNFHMSEIGNKIKFKGRLLKKGLIVQYEKEVMP